MNIEDLKHPQFVAMLDVERERKDGEVVLWTSFSDTDGPKGVVVVKAVGPAHGLKKIFDLGLFPGGEAQTLVLTDDDCIKPEHFDVFMNSKMLVDNDYI